MDIRNITWKTHEMKPAHKPGCWSCVVHGGTCQTHPEGEEKA